MLHTATFDVRAALSPVRRSIGLRRLLHWSLRGLAGGAALGAALLLLARLTSVPQAGLLALVACLLGTALSAGFALLHWPSLLEAARAVDRHFALRDQVTTALEFDGASGPIVALQRRGVAQAVRELPLRRSAAYAVRRVELAGGCAAAGLLLLALILPVSSPAHPVLAHRVVTPLDRTRAIALAHLRVISRQFAAGLTPQQRQSTQAQHALAIMSKLESQLRRARTQEEALRDISAAQADLHHLSSTLHPVSGATETAFTKAMKGNITRQQQADLLKGRQNLDKAASKFLASLGGSAAAMSANQKAQTARALEQAANQVPDGPLRDDLRQAAGALGHNDVKTAQRALKHASSRFENSANQRATRRGVNNTQSNLNSIKNDVNGTKRRSPGPGNGPVPPPNAPRSPVGPNDASGSTSPGTGVGGNNGKHSRGGRLHGAQGEDKASAGGGKDRAGANPAGPSAVVYVPGVVTAGGNPLPYDLHGTPKRVPAVPYQQVLGRYSRTARASLDRSPLPTGVRDYVRRYFTALSRQ